MNQVRYFNIIIITLFLMGCETVYYNTMEKFGVQKRDILTSRVEKVRDAQVDAKDQFQSALEQFSSVVNFDGGDLEVMYKKMNGEYEDSESKAKAVNNRIKSVENVADALFAEWEGELEQYSNASLKAQSRQELIETRAHYEKLLQSMKRAAAKMNPVLTTFHDQVLFLKHNLNAKAIASLQGSLDGIKTDVSKLVSEMESAIDEANSFIQTYEAQNKKESK
ncbi:DUF2959 domain-containing protein [Candidatus Nitrosacidococcus sp. I8]|uniref:DUF2959 domain-containing protein n=1 Tax=Candidatus Nitrosacidococcus sp. I8 TaxID=2942908 RepID=UPI002227185B|nr:DUF2959 domain-containing protein [Candidatus Nitrosacidococcus sp. I8]CAH9017869.1 hypothetical protein NURINAE_00599 [Candidatus Nitrosacidococcus sp. I8]